MQWHTITRRANTYTLTHKQTNPCKWTLLFNVLIHVWNLNEHRCWTVSRKMSQRNGLKWFLKGSSEAHFSLGCSRKVCNKPWLKFLRHHFYLHKNSFVVLVHVSLNDNERLLTPPLSSLGEVDTRQPAMVDRIQMSKGRNMLTRDRQRL